MAVDSLYQQLVHYLCPPGNGVFTVHTASELRTGLQQSLYGKTDSLGIEERWQQSLDNLANVHCPLLLGVCSDNGGGILRGANWGPLFIRQALYQQQPPPLFELGDVRVIPHLLLDDYLNKKTIGQCRQALYGNASVSRPVSPLSITLKVLTTLYRHYPQKKVVGLGGDHSVSYALVKPFLLAKRRQGKRVAIIHFDAHTDLLPQRLGIDICFGSWAYHILPLLPHPDHLLQIGIRSSAHDKTYWETTLGVKQYWASDVENADLTTLIAGISTHLQERKIDELYITFDIDALDIEQAGATGTPEPQGLTTATAMAIIEGLGAQFLVTGGDLVEVAPFIVHQSADDPANTLRHAGEIVKCLLKVMQ